MGRAFVVAGRLPAWWSRRDGDDRGLHGVFLVYLQHNFEDTYWDHRPDLRHDLAALQGSSALDLGWWFDLATGNIAYHDIHHFNANIPSYRLRRCHRELREAFGPAHDQLARGDPQLHPEALGRGTGTSWCRFPRREGWFRRRQRRGLIAGRVFAPGSERDA